MHFVWDYGIRDVSRGMSGMVLGDIKCLSSQKNPESKSGIASYHNNYAWFGIGVYLDYLASWACDD